MPSMSHTSFASVDPRFVPMKAWARRPEVVSDSLVHLGFLEQSMMLTLCTMHVERLLKEITMPTCLRCIALAERWGD